MREIMTQDEAVTAYAFEEARRANSWAQHIGMQPVPYRADRLPQRIGVEIKYDGLGLCYRDGLIMTLQGVDIRCASHLQGGLDALGAVYRQPMFIQGEYIHADGFNAAQRAFRSGTPAGAVMIFDAVPIAAWDGLEPSAPLIERREMLAAAFAAAVEGLADIGLAQQAQGFDQEGVELAAGEAWADGLEGIVAKDLDSPFVRGPSPFWMKLKREETIDAPIVGVGLAGTFPGSKLLSFDVRIDGKETKVARGWTLLQEHDPDQFRIGRMVEIKHNGRTEGGALKGVSFVRFRDDKEPGHA